MIIVTGELVIDPKDLANMRGQMRSATEVARAEANCITYVMAIEDEGTGSVVILEKWTDEAALQAHLARPEVQAFVGLLQRVVTEIDLRMYDASNERVVAGVGA